MPLNVNLNFSVNEAISFSKFFNRDYASLSDGDTSYITFASSSESSSSLKGLRPSKVALDALAD